MSEIKDMYSTALFDETRIYRYSLYRIWDHKIPLVNFVMLNPSTADHTEDDPTIRRCIGFARGWANHGRVYGGIVVTNLYAYRATDPADLTMFPNAIGNGNDGTIMAEAEKAGLIVCAWGANKYAHGTGVKGPSRAQAVRKMFYDLGFRVHVLRLTKDGYPSHPLYLPKTLTPVPWEYRT